MLTEFLFIAPYKSVKGVGRRGPNFKQSIVLSNGATVPCGKVIDYPQDANNGGNPWAWNSLQHNEYIVYDTSQIKIRYLVQVKNRYKNSQLTMLTNIRPEELETRAKLVKEEKCFS